MKQISVLLIEDHFLARMALHSVLSGHPQIRIIGEAAHPQAIPYRQEMTALDVMIVVGGLTDFADGNRAILMRAAEGGKQYNVRLKDLIKKGDISANVDMKPGDIVLIPQSWF